MTNRTSFSLRALLLAMLFIAALAALAGWALSLGKEDRIAKHRFQEFVNDLSGGLGEFENTQTRNISTRINECGHVGLTFAKPNADDDVIVDLHVSKGIGNLLPWSPLYTHSTDGSYVLTATEQTCVIEIPQGSFSANTAITATPTANAEPALYRWICLGRIDGEWRVDRFPFTQDQNQSLTRLVVIAPMESEDEPIQRNMGYECLQLLLPKLDQQLFYQPKKGKRAVSPAM